MKKSFFWCCLAVLALSGCQRQETIEIIINGETSSTPEAICESGDFCSEKIEDLTPAAQDYRKKTETVATTSAKGRITAAVPKQVLWPVIFVSQAPSANWDELHEEACEEASLITVDSYFKGLALDARIMEDKIQALVAWEEDQGYGPDLTVEQAREVSEKYFNLSARVITEVTVDRLKYELAQGRLIIVPAAGRELGNPYFRQPGPIYHMLVIKGYNDKQFITNDVGTRRGDGFKYDYARLLSAVHDWNLDLAVDGMTDEEMLRGRAAVLVVEK